MTAARFTLTAPATDLASADALADAIDQHFAISALAVSVNETDETLSLWAVTGWFEDKASAIHARDTLGLAAVIAPVPDVDWVRRSLEGLAPVTAGRFFLHGSHDRARRRAGGVSLEIDAGTAFGTGHHGTTAGCLLALDHILKSKRPSRIFDLGCGTGVLAIAAARATGQCVLATDIDAEAVRVTLANAALNHVRPSLRGYTAAGLQHPAIRAAAPFDLIFANILARPLASLAPGLSALLARGGRLILSGLTRDQVRWIKACYLARGLALERTLFLGNWGVVVLRRNAKRPPRDRRFEFGSRGSGRDSGRKRRA